jgi:hypothetical protein
MERAIEQADFRVNRAFLSWALPSVDGDLHKIDPIYLEPLENRWGDIPSEFKKMKEKARRALWDMEEVYDQYTQIVESSDPAEALSIAEEIESSFGCMGGVSLPLPDDLFDPDCLSTVTEHKQKYEQLKSAGKLDPFLAHQQELVKAIAEDVGPKMPLGPDDVCLLEISYAPDTLGELVIRIQYAKEGELSLPVESCGSRDNTKSFGIFASQPGSIKAYFIPARYDHWRKKSTSWTEHLMAHTPYILLDVTEEVYKHLSLEK